MAKKTLVAFCEVCGTETDCMETKDEILVCSSACRKIAEGTDSKIPLDSMMGMSQRGYFAMGSEA